MKNGSAGEQEAIEAALSGLAQVCFQLGEEVLDGVEIRAVGRQEHQRSASGFAGLANPGHLVRTQIVGDDKVTRPPRRSQHVAHISQKGRPVHRSIQKPGGFQTIAAQGCHEGVGPPVAVRDFVDAALPLLGPAVSSGHFGGEARFIQEDRSGAFPDSLIATPLFPRLPNVLALLLAGVQRFF